MQNPAFVYEFEKATVRFGDLGEDGGSLKAVFRDGTVKDYGVSSPHGWSTKLAAMVSAARGDEVVLPCPAEAARRHTSAMEMIRAKNPDSEVFPADSVRVDGDLVWVPGLKDRLVACYENCEML